MASKLMSSSASVLVPGSFQPLTSFQVTFFRPLRRHQHAHLHCYHSLHRKTDKIASLHVSFRDHKPREVSQKRAYLPLATSEDDPETLSQPEDTPRDDSSSIQHNGNGGKPGFISFYNPRNKAEDLLIPPEEAQSTWGRLLWLIGPTVLVSSFTLPPIYLRRIVSAVFEDSLLTDFLILFFTEALFYCGVAAFLLITHRSKTSSTRTNPSQLGQTISSVATLVLSLMIPMVTMGFVWPWTGPAASATLAPYLVGIVVQFAFEQYARYRKSPSSLTIPIIFQVYRLHQLNRAAQLVTALLFTVKGAEATVNNLEIKKSLEKNSNGESEISCGKSTLIEPIRLLAFDIGSHVLLPWSSPTWSKGLVIKRPVTTIRLAGRKEKSLRLKQSCCFSLGSPCSCGLKAKSFKVTSFKGGIQNSESGGRESGKKVTNNSVKLSYRSDDDENNVNSSPKAQNTSLSYTSEADDSVTGQPAIQKLFKKWLTLLRTQSPTQVADEALGGEEEAPQTTKPETETEIKKTESLQSTKSTLWTLFWSLDASVKIPLLLFVPAFLAVNAIYGAEVTKELSPLWIAGPLIVALYVKMFQGLCTLYAFCFKQTAKVIRNLPSYYIMAYHYIAQGKLRDDVRGLVTRPMVAVKNADYKEITGAKLKQLREWLVEKYLDFVESIWPYYCRTIRFLKRANLI
ncbi:unnamed protein product [Brassica rapa subsp. trilocularis]